MKKFTFLIFLLFTGFEYVKANEGVIVYGHAASDIRVCGYAKETTFTQQTQEIFDEVSQQIAYKIMNIPKLVIVNSSPNCDINTAKVYTEGYVLISISMVEKIFHTDINRKANAEMAFVIGHELAHIVMGVLEESFFDNIIPEDLAPEIQKVEEYKADTLGFVLAGISGYAVDEIIKNDNFFSRWSPHESGDHFYSSTHPPSQERAKNLMKIFQDIIEKIKYFKFGVRLSYFDKCQDAAYFLHKFRRIFPARETFNNVGYCHLTEALKKWGADAYYYWLPMILDFNTLADTFSRREMREFRREQQGHVITRLLKEAKRDFEKAIDSDPDYLPAYINLATTTFLIDEPHHLKEVNWHIARAKDIAPDNLELKMLEQLVLYEQAKSKSDDLWAVVVNELDTLFKEYDNVPLSVTYNLARLYQQRGRVHGYWKQLAQQVDALPPQIADIVCSINDSYCLDQKEQPSKSWPLPKITQTLVFENDSFPQWNKIKFDFDWAPELQQYYKGAFFQHVEDDIEFMTLNGYPQLVVLKDVNEFPESLQDYCGFTLRSTVRGRDTFKICSGEWIALIKNNAVKEVWIVPERE